MYAEEATVRKLAANVVSNLDAADIARIGEDADAEIDAELGRMYWWPYSQAGVDLRSSPPAQIVTIANYLVAGLLEQQRFAHTEAGGPEPNPYGKSLERRGRQLLKDIVEGRALVPNLVAYGPLRHREETDENFTPVTGFYGRGTGGVIGIRGRRNRY